MESKNVIISVLLMSLVLAQIRVEAKSCCPSTTARNIYNVCRAGGGSRPVCASLSGCKIISGTTCPSCCPHVALQASGEYCELGCVSSVCSDIANLDDSVASEVVNGAIEKCTNACAAFCAKKDSAEI